MSLRNYRPVMTSNYTLDWLNAFKLKDVHAMRVSKLGNKVTMLQTASYVNQSMSQVMHGNAAIWGVKENKTGYFVGILALQNVDLQGRSARISASFVDGSEGKNILREIVVHVIKMLRTDLKLNSLFVAEKAVADFTPVLAELNFEQVEYSEEPALAKFMLFVR